VNIWTLRAPRMAGMRLPHFVARVTPEQYVELTPVRVLAKRFPTATDARAWAAEHGDLLLGFEPERAP
jgi:hypothetical protein